MSHRLTYFSCRMFVLAAIAIPFLSLGGCRAWNFHKDFWNVERYRDHRAADIDERLSKDVPVGKDVF